MAFRDLFRDMIATTDYGENAKAVISKSLKFEESVRDAIDKQREFIEAVVEWSSSKEENKILVHLGKHFADISFDWIISQEHFLVSIVKVRNEFEVLRDYYRDQDTYERKHLKAEKRFLALEHYKHSDNSKKRSEALKAEATRDRRRQELNSYNKDRTLGTMIKAKYALKQLAHGYMYMGSAAQKIYSQFEQEIERKITAPHSETHLAVVEHLASLRSSRQTSNATTPSVSRAPSSVRDATNKKPEVSVPDKRSSRADSASSRSTLPDNSHNEAIEQGDDAKVETVTNLDAQQSPSSFDAAVAVVGNDSSSVKSSNIEIPSTQSAVTMPLEDHPDSSLEDAIAASGSDKQIVDDELDRSGPTRSPLTMHTDDSDNEATDNETHKSLAVDTL